MRIRSVTHNNRRKVFEVRTSSGILVFPFSKAEPSPTTEDPIAELRVDAEAGREAFTYVLRSGRTSTVHVEQVLEYNQDATYLRNLLLYKLTLEAQKRSAESQLSKREIIRRLETSATQLYRLLDQTNYRKSVDQVLALLQVLNCHVDLVVRSKTLSEAADNALTVSRLSNPEPSSKPAHDRAALWQTMSRHTEIRFVSSNPHKITEAEAILNPREIRVIPSALKIEELQTTDAQKLVQDKLLKAYKEIGRPLFVEHTGLYIAGIGGLPGGLTQIFWDTLQAERFAELFGGSSSKSNAIARTSIAYCDGRRIYTFDGEIAGLIVEQPRGPRDFQWDCVFQPEGHEQTFAEMGDQKNAISMRRAALDKLAAHLTRGTVQ